MAGPGRSQRQPRKLRAVHVLIADEFPVIRVGLRAMLEGSNFKVVGEAPTTDDTFRLIDDLSPDLVILALEWRQADGLNILRHIKEKWPKLPVVILTSAPTSLSLGRAIALGCSGYLQKSVEREQLLSSLEAVTRGERGVEPKLWSTFLKDASRQRVEVEDGTRLVLTIHEREILRLIAEGRTNRQIAQRLGYSVGTVKDYVQDILQKLEVSGRTHAAVKALRLGLLD
jgi:DNA-binding NarL/FixJ family response regulator